MNERSMFYQVEEFDGYYRIGSPENAFSYLLKGSEKAALIDTGYGLGDLRSVVGSLTDLPLIIINTHGHCDHVGGNAQFDVPCYIHPADMDMAEVHTSPEWRRSDAERMMKAVDYETGRIYNALPEGFDMESHIKRGTGSLEPVHEADKFDLGGRTLTIIETPGHTAGGISIIDDLTNYMFIGDATGFFVWLFAEESTGKQSYLDMLDKIGSYNVKGYLGGHNPVIMTHEDLVLYRKAAIEADYSKGEPFQSFFGMEKKPRVCPLPGQTMADMFKPGFASVVIAEDW